MKIVNKRGKTLHSTNRAYTTEELNYWYHKKGWAAINTTKTSLYIKVLAPGGYVPRLRKHRVHKLKELTLKPLSDII